MLWQSPHAIAAALAVPGDIPHPKRTNTRMAAARLTVSLHLLSFILSAYIILSSLKYELLT
jgi:hypothetical protein